MRQYSQGYIKRVSNKMDIWVWRCITIFLFIKSVDCSSWSDWWTYDGISGPDLWGIINPTWRLCSSGKHQSPIDINPRSLVYDQNLQDLAIDDFRVDGSLMNTGHDITITINEPAPYKITIVGGPLSYQYTLANIKIHYGNIDFIGSEHTVNQQQFPAEFQFLAYNSDLYTNFSSAMEQSHGLAGIAAFGSLSESTNTQFEIITKEIRKIKNKGDQILIRGLSIVDLLPDLDNYMTYEGSLTQPGCQETVTWIVLNKPIHITKNQSHGCNSRQITFYKGEKTNGSGYPPHRLVMNNHAIGEEEHAVVRKTLNPNYACKRLPRQHICRTRRQKTTTYF